jgi:hypothetical protein
MIMVRFSKQLLSLRTLDLRMVLKISPYSWQCCDYLDTAFMIPVEDFNMSSLTEKAVE